MGTILDYEVFSEKYPFVSEFLKVLYNNGQEEANKILLSYIPPEDGPLNSIQISHNELNTAGAGLFLLECWNQGYIHVSQEVMALGIYRFFSYQITVEGINAYQGYLKKQQGYKAIKYEISLDIKNSPNTTITVGNNNSIKIGISPEQASEILNIIANNKEDFPEGLIKALHEMENTGLNAIQKIEKVRDWIFGGIQALGAGAGLITPILGA